MIAVISEGMIDRNFFGECNRISPEGAFLIVNHLSTVDNPGGGYNVYECVKKLTSDVVYSVKVDNPPIKFRVFAKNQQLIRLDYEGNSSWEILDNYKNSSVCIVSDYNKGLFDKLSDIPDLPYYTIVDPKKSLDKYYGAWCLKPNRVEFESYVGKWTSMEELKNHMIETTVKLNITHLIVTLGEDGIVYYGAEDSHYEIFHSHAHEIVCCNGAGDQVTAVIAACIHRGDDMISAIRLANYAAGISVKHLGTYQVSASEIGF